MREILFRGKRVDNGEWETGSLLVERMNTSDQQVMIADKMTGYPTLVLPETIGQYTGLCDKNGVKIFEGDVVKSIAAWYAVEFENGGYGLRLFGKGELIPIMGRGNFNANEVEVIGNVFDNPELLEVIVNE